MSVLDELVGKVFPVLDAGSVCLADAMGDDAAICRAARISYGGGTKTVSDDRTLIRYLMRHHHATPFEMCSVKLIVRAPIDVWRQMERHRAGRIADGLCMWDEPSINEYSTRYSEAIDAMHATDPAAWRAQATDNKQGSGAGPIAWPDKYFVEEYSVVEDGDGDRSEGDGYCVVQDHGDGRQSFWNFHDAARPPTPGDLLSRAEADLQSQARQVYERRLAFGVAREQARKDLPLSTYTQAYWKCDLRNVLGFLALRMDGHAQQEIREYANVIGHEIVAKLFPDTWGAFRDYTLDAMTLSGPDVEVIRAIRSDGLTPGDAVDAAFANRRERDECRAKLARLGLIPGGGERP